MATLKVTQPPPLVSGKAPIGGIGLSYDDCSLVTAVPQAPPSLNDVGVAENPVTDLDGQRVGMVTHFDDQGAAAVFLDDLVTVVPPLNGSRPVREINLQ